MPSIGAFLAALDTLVEWRDSVIEKRKARIIQRVINKKLAALKRATHNKLSFLSYKGNVYPTFPGMWRIEGGLTMSCDQYAEENGLLWSSYKKVVE